MKFDSIGWSTTKIGPGAYKGRVYGVRYQKPTVDLYTQNAGNRAELVRKLKQKALVLRRANASAPSKASKGSVKDSTIQDQLSGTEYEREAGYERLFGKRNPGHRKGSLTQARAVAKTRLRGMPLGSIVMIGQWIDNGEYEAKTGGGSTWMHERFRPVEQWSSAAAANGQKRYVKLTVKRSNPATKAPTGKTKEVVDVIINIFQKDPKATFHPSLFTMTGYRSNTAPAIRWLKKMGMLRVAYYNVDNQPVYGLAGETLPDKNWARKNPSHKGKNMARKNPKGSFPAPRSPKVNPYRRTPLNKSKAIPKGVRAGERFTRDGKTFVVVSYIHPSSGKRVRFARRVKARR